MKKSELIARLSSMPEDEVYVEIDDVQYDMKVDVSEATFDGFYTVYPAAVIIKPIVK